MSHVTIVAHDAGGAEIISCWIALHKGTYSLALKGPACKIFKKKYPDAEILSLEDALKNADWVLCGTGWQSSFEKEAIKYAKNRNIRVVAYLDHWVNYKQRFMDGEKEIYPDEIWVADQNAQKIAEDIFFDTPIILKGNPYLDELKKNIIKLKLSKTNNSCLKKSVLYVCEPKREHALIKYGNERYWGYTEEEALEFFYNNLKYIDENIDIIRVRPHPSEKEGKYSWFKEVNPSLIKIVGEEDLIIEIINSDIVVGCESMALVVGLLANKQVISSIPPEGRICQLPQKEIQHLRNLIM